MGYSGGRDCWPTYGAIGDHTESIQIEFNPERTPFSDIVDFVLRFGGKNGSQTRQYMTAMWFHSDGQREHLAAAGVRRRELYVRPECA